MSRKIIIMCAAFTFLAVLSVVEQIAVGTITGAALEQTREIMAKIRAGGFDTAAGQAQELDKTWDRQAKWLEIMVDHGSTDEVRYAFSRLLAALEQQDSATAMVYACELEGAIEHVYERQALTVENIF